MRFTKKQLRELRKRLLGETADQKKQTVHAERNEFIAACLRVGLPEPKPEFRFHPVRKWRFDWLFGDRVAVEIQGGVWTRGRHSRGAGQIADMEKFNEAQVLGYVVLQFTPQQMDSGEAFLVISRALREVPR